MSSDAEEADFLLPLDDGDSYLEQGDDFEDSDYDFEMEPSWSPQMRADHLQTLLMKRKTTVKYLDRKLGASPSASTDSLVDQAYLSEATKQRARHERVALEKVEAYLRALKRYFDLDANTVEVHLKEFCYIVKVDPSTRKIDTVYNRGICYKLSKWLERRRNGIPTRIPKVDKVILEDINLVLKPSKMYLVLGHPGSGKTSLLKAIAGRLSTATGEMTTGSVTYNGLSLNDKKGLHIENAISFIGQSDSHFPRLTVEETFEFAWECKTGATHASKEYVVGRYAEELIEKLDSEKADVKAKLDALDLAHVANTFVGSSEVRGVSGGQRRRVSVGEMMPLTTAPVLCGDEITTGLDAASAYQLLFLLTHYTRLHKMTRIISLLQPTPETVSLFDEIILLAKGKVLYTGPIGNVGSYFASLGYHPPDQMDIADFLQMIPTTDGEELFNPSEEQKRTRSTPYTIDELAEKFRESYHFQRIKSQLVKDGSYQHQWENLEMESGGSQAIVQASLKNKYANGFFWSSWLLLKRNMILWLRDRRFLIVNLIKNVIMGLSVGGVFFQTEAVSSIYGALFQLTLFIMLGAMVVVPDQVSDRNIYYKHYEANFYGAFPYVLGKALALLPQVR
jgi:ABC-type multidrug transport system ATPase subunit